MEKLGLRAGSVQVIGVISTRSQHLLVCVKIRPMATGPGQATATISSHEKLAWGAELTRISCVHQCIRWLVQVVDQPLHYLAYSRIKSGHPGQGSLGDSPARCWTRTPATGKMTRSVVRPWNAHIPSGPPRLLMPVQADSTQMHMRAMAASSARTVVHIKCLRRWKVEQDRQFPWPSLLACSWDRGGHLFLLQAR